MGARSRDEARICQVNFVAACIIPLSGLLIQCGSFGSGSFCLARLALAQGPDPFGSGPVGPGPFGPGPSRFALSRFGPGPFGTRPQLGLGPIWDRSSSSSAHTERHVRGWTPAGNSEETQENPIEDAHRDSP